MVTISTSASLQPSGEMLLLGAKSVSLLPVGRVDCVEQRLCRKRRTKDPVWSLQNKFLKPSLSEVQVICCWSVAKIGIIFSFKRGSGEWRWGFFPLPWRAGVLSARELVLQAAVTLGVDALVPRCDVNSGLVMWLLRPDKALQADWVILWLPGLTEESSRNGWRVSSFISS